MREYFKLVLALSELSPKCCMVAFCFFKCFACSCVHVLVFPCVCACVCMSRCAQGVRSPRWVFSLGFSTCFHQYWWWARQCPVTLTQSAAYQETVGLGWLSVAKGVHVLRACVQCCVGGVWTSRAYQEAYVMFGLMSYARNYWRKAVKRSTKCEVTSLIVYCMEHPLQKKNKAIYFEPCMHIKPRRLPNWWQLCERTLDVHDHNLERRPHLLLTLTKWCLFLNALSAFMLRSVHRVPGRKKHFFSESFKPSSHPLYGDVTAPWSHSGMSDATLEHGTPSQKAPCSEGFGGAGGDDQNVKKHTYTQPKYCHILPWFISIGIINAQYGTTSSSMKLACRRKWRILTSPTVLLKAQVITAPRLP